MESEHPSIEKLSKDFYSTIDEPYKKLLAIHFCDNETDANECLELVLSSEKKATATALWEFEMLDEAIPQVGDRYVVTDWDKVGHCIIETTKITILPFNEITEEHAKLEGEGDKSLAYWQKVHRAFYARQFEGTEYSPDDNMMIVFEEFNVVHPLR